MSWSSSLTSKPLLPHTVSLTSEQSAAYLLILPATSWKPTLAAALPSWGREDPPRESAWLKRSHARCRQGRAGPPGQQVFYLQDLFCTGLTVSDCTVRGWWVQGEGRPPLPALRGTDGCLRVSSAQHISLWPATTTRGWNAAVVAMVCQARGWPLCKM